MLGIFEHEVLRRELHNADLFKILGELFHV